MFTHSETINGAKDFYLPGQYFRLLETVNPVNVELYSKAGEVSKAVQVEAGYFVRLNGFDRVRITTGASEAVKFVYGDGSAGYDRLFASVTISDVSIDAGDTLTNSVVVVGTAAAVLAALNAARGGLVVQNEGPAVIYLGGAGVTTANGISLAPGEKFTSPSPRAALSAISATAGNNVRVLETT